MELQEKQKVHYAIRNTVSNLFNYSTIEMENWQKFRDALFDTELPFRELFNKRPFMYGVWMVCQIIDFYQETVHGDLEPVDREKLNDRLVNQLLEVFDEEDDDVYGAMCNLLNAVEIISKNAHRYGFSTEDFTHIRFVLDTLQHCQQKHNEYIYGAR